MINRISAALLLINLAVSAAAQDDPVVEEIREFNVEVIVFAYAQEVSVGTEVFVPDEIPTMELEELGDDFAGNLQEPSLMNMPLPELKQYLSDDDVMPDFTLLTETDFTMQDIADRMRRLDVYDVLLHAGWTQAARPEDESITMQLDMLAPLPAELSGSFKLYLSRFLHLVADLELDAPGNPAIPVAIEQPRELVFDRPVRPSGPIHYRIQEDRIFRSDETRYYDHPKFGIVARVTRYEPPEPIDTDAALEDEAQGPTD